MTEAELLVIEDMHAILKRILLLGYKLSNITVTESSPADKELLDSTHDELESVRTRLSKIRGRQGNGDNQVSH